MPKVLITSIAEKIPHLQALESAACKALGWKVVASDCNPNCIGALIAKEFWHIDLLSAYRPEQLIKDCIDREIRAIIPTSAIDLEYFSKHKNAFLDSDISIHVSDQATINKCIDKRSFYQNTASKFKDISIPLVDDASLIQNEHYVVKENKGSGSVNIGIRLTASEALKHGEILDDPIYQPYVSGDEFSADTYCNIKGQCMGVVLRWRDQVVCGESQVSTIFKNIELENQIADFVENLQIYGHACTQGILEDHTKLHIIETNPRIGGASTLSLKAGLDSFYWFLVEASGKDLIADRKNLEIKKLQLVRHKQDHYCNG